MGAKCCVYLSEPLTTPSNFELVPDKEVQPKSAEFQWDAVNTSSEAMRGEFKGYKVRTGHSSSFQDVMVVCTCCIFIGSKCNCWPFDWKFLSTNVSIHSFLSVTVVTSIVILKVLYTFVPMDIQN